MPDKTPDPPLSFPFEPWDWLAGHPAVALALAALCLWVSVWLILRMWHVHRQESLVHKSIWTVFLLVPLFGWIFYAGFFRVPDLHDSPCEVGTAGQWGGG